MRRTIRMVMLLTLLGSVVAACGDGALASQAAAEASRLAALPSGSVDQAAAEAYCTEKGGQLTPRIATWNTNSDPSAWLQLAGRWTLCEFEMGEGDQTTRISVDLTTLYSEEPTLAAIAYLSKVQPSGTSSPSGNPASFYCTEDLDGSSQFGNTAAGGGWVDQSQPTFVIMNMCVFADGSAIDEFGLFYYSDGTVRGADLAPLFRYQPGNRLPAVYE